ncbi:restriction endonuclease subunit S [Neisseria subflava]|uniref:restriction endonuclease subunit S n=1 Tax=Neisseria subflava TaxID=28449 RepID=UPI0016617BBF|nr:restriction endonuclease subunit S [Neisseria sp. KH1003-01]
MNKQQEPRLRFKGFTGAWEEKRLSDVVEIVGGGTPDTNNSAYWGGEIDWYSPTEIGENVYANGSIRKITLLGLQKSSAVILPADRTVLFTSRASIGDMAILTKQGATNQGFQSFIVREGLNIYFLYTMGFKIKEYALKNASGSTFLEISKTQLLQMESLFPSLTEQTHLGLFFRRLDSQIAESRAVLEKSRQLKKAMLAKMFPANGEKIPKIRFKGFEGGWKREILKDVVNVFDNLRIPVSENKRTSGNTPYFGANGIQDYVDGFTHNGEFVLIAEDGANDLKNYPVQYVNGKCWVNNHAHVLQGKSEILNNIFLFSRFQSMDISQFLVGGGRAKLNGSTMLEIEIEFPKDKKEQTAIGLFFRQLDETIALQTAEVEKLNQLKKGLLAAMLV